MNDAHWDTERKDLERQTEGDILGMLKIAEQRNKC